jgi:hypothetical protein
MEDLLNQFFSIILASKKIPEVPEAGALSPNGLIIFYNETTERVESIKGNLLASTQPNWAISNIGVVPTAGDTTTGTEIIDFVNLTGFVVNSGNIKIIEMIVKRATISYVRKYLFKPNTVGIFGDGAGNPIALGDLYLLVEDAVGDGLDLDTVTVDLGDIGASTIHDYINVNNSPSFNLISNTVYVFSCVRNAISERYLYIGALPAFLGAGNQVTSANDWELIESTVWRQIDGGEVRKRFGNTNINAIEPGDEVRYKSLSNGGAKIYLIYGIYQGGDQNLEESYDVPQLLV